MTEVDKKDPFIANDTLHWTSHDNDCGQVVSISIDSLNRLRQTPLYYFEVNGKGK